jgi:hypothetical protein
MLRLRPRSRAEIDLARRQPYPRWPVKRFAAILMFIGAVLAGGGARFAHVMVAHSGSHAGSRAEVQSCGAKSSCDSHAHGGHSHPGPANEGDCAICDELASLTPTLSAPCTLAASLELLAILDALEASQIADPAPIAAVSARPPPARA